jgi:xanthine dehydrogenase accessory factor
MKEIRDIVKAFERAQQEGQCSALATVVHVEGSSYRRPGARMLITADGRLTGAISGGCLEGDALRKALFAIHQHRNKLVTYDTTHEDDLLFGVQLGCNGVVHILFEPILNDAPDNPIGLLKELISERKESVLATIFSLDRSEEQPGTTLLYREGRVRTKLAGQEQEMLWADSETALATRSSRFGRYLVDGREFNAFLQFIPPPPALVIAGAGNDVQPLVLLTSMLGWHTTVVDGRPHYATAERFPKADRVVVAAPGTILDRIDPDPQTLFVLMTHNYNYDLALLTSLLGREYPYIGLLGPRKKFLRMLTDLREKGITPGDRQLNAIHGPVGLDIGAETAEEIAVSIVAEIQATLAGRSALALNKKQTSIHV